MRKQCGVEVELAKSGSSRSGKMGGGRVHCNSNLDDDDGTCGPDHTKPPRNFPIVRIPLHLLNLGLGIVGEKIAVR